MRAILILAIALAGCASGTARWCPEPIRVSPDDHLTPETARAILTLDRQIVAVCGR